MTTNVELEDYAKKHGINLNAVITKDLLIEIKQKEGGYIINLGNSNTGGTHWVALYLTHFPRESKNKKKYAFYFDSFGLPPPKEIYEYALKWTKSPIYIIENSKKIQALNSGFCGSYSILFIHNMDDKNNNPYQNFSNYLKKFKLNKN